MELWPIYHCASKCSARWFVEVWPTCCELINRSGCTAAIQAPMPVPQACLSFAVQHISAYTVPNICLFSNSPHTKPHVHPLPILTQASHSLPPSCGLFALFSAIAQISWYIHFGLMAASSQQDARDEVMVDAAASAPGVVPNRAGGLVFQVDQMTRLRRFLILGSDGELLPATQRVSVISLHDANSTPIFAANSLLIFFTLALLLQPQVPTIMSSLLFLLWRMPCASKPWWRGRRDWRW